MNESKNIWIENGYKMYSSTGISGIKIEKLAKKIEKSKSSFYHYFADLECFEEVLFDHHYKQCLILAEKEKSCKTIYPDLINILLEHKTDLLFNRQLRIDRNNITVEKALEKSQKILGNYALMLWTKQINIKLSTDQLEGLFEIATDDFYMRINDNNLNYEFLSSYFKNLTQITEKFL
jgi:AcrR family transcriptional regulator